MTKQEIPQFKSLQDAVAEIGETEAVELLNKGRTAMTRYFNVECTQDIESIVEEVLYNADEIVVDCVYENDPDSPNGPVTFSVESETETLETMKEMFMAEELTVRVTERKDR